MGVCGFVGKPWVQLVFKLSSCVVVVVTSASNEVVVPVVIGWVGGDGGFQCWGKRNNEKNVIYCKNQGEKKKKREITKTNEHPPLRALNINLLS